ncbi:hypothetical protein [Tateyamaria pelophila]|uniref:hypothetical protein n=1 Tax=Tateyamaria pelophila TaxID=328415 RepID=UPI001CBDF3F5|nr:hypothetical protein [Tateyamaria pelophila]
MQKVQHVMDRGFADDPTVQWILDTPKAFAVEHHQYVAPCAALKFEHGGVLSVGDFEGTTIWYPMIRPCRDI